MVRLAIAGKAWRVRRLDIDPVKVIAGTVGRGFEGDLAPDKAPHVDLRYLVNWTGTSLASIGLGKYICLVLQHGGRASGRWSPYVDSQVTNERLAEELDSFTPVEQRLLVEGSCARRVAASPATWREVRDMMLATARRRSVEMASYRASPENPAAQALAWMSKTKSSAAQEMAKEAGAEAAA